MNTNTTHLFDLEEINDSLVQDLLRDVYNSLDERGYNPIVQIVGYLTTGDPGYISSHNDARNKISKLDRSQIVEALVKSYIKGSKWDI